MLIRLVFLPRSLRSWGYAERDDDLLVRHGLMYRRLSIVPYGRMQFVDVTAGPLERLFGLATVQLHTAAAAIRREDPWPAAGRGGPAARPAGRARRGPGGGPVTAVRSTGEEPRRRLHPLTPAAARRAARVLAIAAISWRGLPEPGPQAGCWRSARWWCWCWSARW